MTRVAALGVLRLLYGQLLRIGVGCSKSIKTCRHRHSDSPTNFSGMVNLASSFFILLSFVLAITASVVPVGEVKREPDHPAPVVREPEHPLHLAKREATGRRTRHLRPVYENTKREITPPDVGQVATFPSTGIPQPIRGPYGDIRSGGTNEEIDRQNPDYVAPPRSDNGLLFFFFFLPQGSHRTP